VTPSEKAGAPRPVRVIHLAHAAEAYGIGTMLTHLVRAEAAEGSLVSPVLAYHVVGPKIEESGCIGAPVYLLGPPRRLNTGWRAARLFRHADVVVLHTFSPIVFLAALLVRKPVIFVFHGAFGFRGGLRDPSLGLLYRRFLVRRSARIVFASQWCRDWFCERTGSRLPASRSVVFPFGLNTESVVARTKPSELRQAHGLGGALVVGTAARLDPYKRIEAMLDAVAASGIDVTAIVMGTGRESYEADLRERARQLGIMGRVLFLGYRPDALGVIAALDLFVLPSRGEPFGLALLEAMALGVPCAVFEDGGGCVELLGDGGVVVESPEDLGRVIVRLGEDQAFKADLARRARARAGQLHVRETAKRFRELYEAVGRKAPRP
jgi:glycosyltransferase involved in cell wall biosynthesis